MMTIALMLLALMLLTPTVRANPEPCADARHRQTVNEWPVPTGHRVQRPRQRACNGGVSHMLYRMSPQIGHSARPDHYRNARLVPSRDGSFDSGQLLRA
jgi:hypothetical protein